MYLTTINCDVFIFAPPPFRTPITIFSHAPQLQFIEKIPLGIL